MYIILKARNLDAQMDEAADKVLEMLSNALYNVNNMITLVELDPALSTIVDFKEGRMIYLANREEK